MATEPKQPVTPIRKRKLLPQGCLLGILVVAMFSCFYSFFVLMGFADMPDNVFRSYIEVYPNSTYLRDILYGGGTNTTSRVRYYWTRDSITQVKTFYNLNIDSSDDSAILYPKDNLLVKLLRYLIGACDFSDSCHFYEFNLQVTDIENKVLTSLPFPNDPWFDPKSFILSESLSGGTLISYDYSVPDP